jgi:hypothetical protein
VKTYSTKRTIGIVFAAALAVVTAPWSSSQAAPGSPTEFADNSGSQTDERQLELLLERFTQAPGISAEFREEKQISLLRDPLVSEGSIVFAPPGRLVRRTRIPSASVLLITGSRLSYQAGGERRSLDVDSHPMIRATTDIFRLVLAGDSTALMSRFDVQTSILGDDQWTIALRPRLAPLTDTIHEIRIEGSADRLSKIYIGEINGDESTTTFSDMDTNRQFSIDEAEQIFRLPES